jgi:hypothetical protein
MCQGLNKQDSPSTKIHIATQQTGSLTERHSVWDSLGTYHDATNIIQESRLPAENESKLATFAE